MREIGLLGFLWYPFSLSAQGIISTIWQWLVSLAETYEVLAFLCGLAFYALLSSVYSNPEKGIRQKAKRKKAERNSGILDSYFFSSFILLLMASFAEYALTQPWVAYFVPSLLNLAGLVTAILGLATLLASIYILQVLKRRKFYSLTLPSIGKWLIACSVVVFNTYTLGQLAVLTSFWWLGWVTGFFLIVSYVGVALSFRLSKLWLVYTILSLSPWIAFASALAIYSLGLFPGFFPRAY